MALEPAKYINLIQSVFGDDHSPQFPGTWSLAWLDTAQNEITGTGYARVPVANASALWAVDGATVTNLEAIDGGTQGASDWPDIYYLALCDEFGDLVITGALTTPVTPVSGTPVVLLAGDAVVSVDA